MAAPAEKEVGTGSDHQQSPKGTCKSVQVVLSTMSPCTLHSAQGGSKSKLWELLRTVPEPP